MVREVSSGFSPFAAPRETGDCRRALAATGSALRRLVHLLRQRPDARIGQFGRIRRGLPRDIGRWDRARTGAGGEEDGQNQREEAEHGGRDSARMVAGEWRSLTHKARLSAKWKPAHMCVDGWPKTATPAIDTS
ncbi:hypothetical protein [Mesorhizobium sp. BE184]|uniref:hypothetical protein n=1 Tax=Mesorhizobium sp. BE184 TaxID=2817714 RepID=UPI002865151D|nr:hypothetical protein [Mesorhizobium sp. BE184]MDR7031510.1 hypothetical protein [Mesorhizobium sp. BE184]